MASGKSSQKKKRTNENSDGVEPRTGMSLDEIKHLQECAEKKSVPLTKSLIKEFKCFYNLKLVPLKYLDDGMMKIYSSAFLYSRSANVKRQAFHKGMKKEIFENALKEILEWEEMAAKENRSTACNKSLTCNLYSIMFNE